MKNAWKIAVVCLVILGIIAVVALKRGRVPTPPEASPAASLPRLVDLGSVSCVPCKMMAPILEDLRRDYAGKLTVEFIDVFEDKAAGERYGVRLIPTQIFFDASGKEFFRHEGFFSREDILAKFKDAGIVFGAPVER